MRKKQLTENQKARINSIIDEWEKERERAQSNMPDSKVRTLDGERTRINIQLEKKYIPMINAIMEE